MTDNSLLLWYPKNLASMTPFFRKPRNHQNRTKITENHTNCKFYNGRTHNFWRKSKVRSPATFGTSQQNALENFVLQQKHGSLSIPRIAIRLYWRRHILAYQKKKHKYVIMEVAKILEKEKMKTFKVIKLENTLFHQQKCLTDLWTQLLHSPEKLKREIEY